MTMYVSCDYCDNQIDREFITLVMPEQFVPAGPADQESYEFHVCDWECLYALAEGMTGRLQETGEAVQGPDGDKGPDGIKIPMEMVQTYQQPRGEGRTPPNQSHGQIVMGNLPLEDRVENKDLEVPFADITKDRREIRIVRKGD